MLSSMVAESMGVAKDARHEYQQKTVDMICDVLEGGQSRLREAVKAAEAAIEDCAGAKAEHEAAIARAGEQCAAAQAEADAKKLILADVARGFQGCKKAVKGARDAQKVTEREVEAASTKRSSLEAALTDLVRPLAEGTLADEEIVRAVTALNRELKKFNIADSLTSALPNSLAKPPAERSPFDTMVVSQLTDEMNKHISGFGATISQAGQVSEQCDAEVKRTEAALEEARAGQLAAAGAFEAAREAVDGCKHEAREAEQRLKQLAPQARNRKRALDHAAASLKAFEAGPLVAAGALKERQEAAEEAPVEQHPVAQAAVEQAAVETTQEAAPDA